VTSRAASTVAAAWRDLPVGTLALGPGDLDLAATLDCGQAFRWRLGPNAWWRGVIGDRAVRIRRVGDACEYQVYPWQGADEIVRRYLRLDVDLSALVEDLARRCPKIRPALRAHPGIRVVGQPPEETLLSFLCSPANSVLRISRSIEQLCQRFGEPIAVLDGAEYQAFPTTATLASLPDAEYRGVGLGWRGLGIRAVAERLLRCSPDWLSTLRESSYAEAKSALVGLPYVGPKIADCVCLFGLLKDATVPVDTHVWALAKELFSDESGGAAITKSLTAKTYDRVVCLYQARYGSYAGWAQQYLYHWRRNGCQVGET
jgi:N-glycosylase/DNA lyase